MKTKKKYKPRKNDVILVQRQPKYSFDEYLQKYKELDKTVIYELLYIYFSGREK